MRAFLIRGDARDDVAPNQRHALTALLYRSLHSFICISMRAREEFFRGRLMQEDDEFCFFDFIFNGEFFIFVEWTAS